MQEANGVAVIDERCSFVISKQPCDSLSWQPASSLVEGIYTNGSQALSDYSGLSNTEKIIEQTGDGEYAAKACHDYVFPDGTNGYLPACGEMNVMFDHIDEVDACIELIGGTAIEDKYWVSSQVNTTTAFTASRAGYRGGEGKGKSYPSIPFKQLNTVNSEQLDFIEFRADKYVDTGININADLKVSLKIKFYSANNSANIIGRWGNPKFTMSISGTSSNWNVIDVFSNDRMTIPISELKVGNVIEIVKDKNMTYINDVLMAEHQYEQYNTADILLIGGNNITFNADVYSFAIWQNDMLIDEFLPVRINGKEYFKGKDTKRLLEVITK